MGRLLDIATRAASRAPMEHHESIAVTAQAGLDGDSRGRSAGRNVTVLSREGWESACSALGEEHPWTTRRANLFVEGVPLAGTTGAQLHVGEIVLEITGECAPCERMEEAHAGLREVLTPNWRAGVLCRVIAEGTLRLGDVVRLETTD
jgi:MOSC domain-containing protein YiiM